MGCGCRKKRSKKLSQRRKNTILDRQEALKSKMQVAIKTKQFREKTIKTRINLCNSCSQSVQNSRDKKYNIQICHKLNRPVDTVAKNFSIGCPIERFQPST